MNEQKNKLTLIVLSGDFDKVFAAYMIATGSAAAGMEVVMLFTFWGLKAIQRGNLTGKSLFGRMAGLMNRGGLDDWPVSIELRRLGALDVQTDDETERREFTDRAATNGN